MTEKELYEKAVLKWGTSSQLMMLYEEIGELMTAINKYYRERVAVNAIIEELADVEIMINQMKVIFGDTEKIKKIKLDKIKKMLEK